METDLRKALRDSEHALELAQRHELILNGDPITRKGSAVDLMREISIAIFGNENQAGIWKVVWKHERILWMLAGSSVLLSLAAVAIEILTYFKK